jgi:hypothetical protein
MAPRQTPAFGGGGTDLLGLGVSGTAVPVATQRAFTSVRPCTPSVVVALRG